MSVWFWPISVLGAALALSGLAYATTASNAKPAPADTNTTITAQRMTVRNQENKAIFEGAVTLSRAGVVVHSDLMVVLFKAEPGAGPKLGEGGQAEAASAEASAKPRNAAKLPALGNRSVSTIEATGRVRIVKDDGQATCAKAVYVGDEDKIVLTGDPVAWQKGARISGKKITMYLAEDRSVVEGESRVMLEPEGSK